MRSAIFLTVVSALENVLNDTILNIRVYTRTGFANLVHTCNPHNDCRYCFSFQHLSILSVPKVETLVYGFYNSSNGF